MDNSWTFSAGKSIIQKRRNIMKEKYILGIDSGTTATTVIIMDSNMNIVAKTGNELPQHYPSEGWVEHDPEEIWNAAKKTVVDAMKSGFIAPDSIACIGITNQRETTILWDRKTLNPLYNAIVWQCRRTSGICDELKAQGLEQVFKYKTGLVLDPYFSGTKIKWLLDSVNGLKTSSHGGKVAFGTVDCFLINRLSAGKTHATDVSNASRTLLLNLDTLEWDDELLKLLEIPASVLPEIKCSSEIIGYTKGLDFLPDGIPISGDAGDQQAALFGQACFAKGEAKCTYGTGAFMLVNTGKEIHRSHHGLITTVGWKYGNEVIYCMEGSAFIAGAAVQWFRDGLGLIRASSEIEQMASQVSDSGDVVFVPALAGLGAPYWRKEARGCITGISRATTKFHIARAILDGMALQIKDIVDAMSDDTGIRFSSLKVDGGASQNNLLMQFQSDILDIPIIRPVNTDTTVTGACFLAGLSAGIWDDADEIGKKWASDREFQPEMDPSRRDFFIKRYREAVKKA
jgi:glycerol kinase